MPAESPARTALQKAPGQGADQELKAYQGGGGKVRPQEAPIQEVPDQASEKAVPNQRIHPFSAEKGIAMGQDQMMLDVVQGGMAVAGAHPPETDALI